MPTPSKVGGRNWRRHYHDALRHLKAIAEEAVLIAEAPHTAQPRAVRIATRVSAAQTAITMMAEIAQEE
jgi:hypothetical protein